MIIAGNELSRAFMFPFAASRAGFFFRVPEMPMRIQ